MTTRADLDAAVAAIDTGNMDLLPLAASLPDGVAGQVMFAARACKRAREASADAIAAACEGRLAEAVELYHEAESHLTVMRKKLTSASELCPPHPRQ